jgi:hypothetical protein
MREQRTPAPAAARGSYRQACRHPAGLSATAKTRVRPQARAGPAARRGCCGVDRHADGRQRERQPGREADDPAAPPPGHVIHERDRGHVVRLRPESGPRATAAKPTGSPSVRRDNPPSCSLVTRTRDVPRACGLHARRRVARSFRLGRPIVGRGPTHSKRQPQAAMGATARFARFAFPMVTRCADAAPEASIRRVVVAW